MGNQRTTLWIEVWADVDRNVKYEQIPKRTWRCTVWETKDGEIDPDGRYYDPRPGHWTINEAIVISRDVARELRADGVRVLQQNSFDKRIGRMAATIKPLLDEMGNPEAWRVTRRKRITQPSEVGAREYHVDEEIEREADCALEMVWGWGWGSGSSKWCG